MPMPIKDIYSGTLVWRWLAGLSLNPPEGEAASTSASSTAMPAIARAAMAYRFYFMDRLRGATHVRLDAALQSVTNSWRTEEWSTRALSELHLGSSRAQTAADDAAVIGRSAVGLAKGLQVMVVGYSQSLGKIGRSIFVDVSGEPDSYAERRMIQAMQGYMSQGSPAWAAQMMAVATNHEFFGSVISGFELYHGESLQPGRVGTRLTPDQYRTQAIMLGIEVAATFLPYVGPAARGGVAVLKAVAFGAARLAFATGIRVSARLAPVLVRLGTVAARLYTVARPVAAVLPRLNPGNYIVRFPLFSGVPIPLVRFNPLRTRLFINFLRDLRAALPPGHLQAGFTRTIRMMETAGTNWRGAYFQAERLLHYYYSGQLIGTELRLGARAIGRRADFLLRNGLRVEVKSWYYGWSTLGLAAKQDRLLRLRAKVAAYLRRPSARLLIEFERSIPTEVLTELQSLAGRYNASGTQRLTWTIIRP